MVLIEHNPNKKWATSVKPLVLKRLKPLLQKEKDLIKEKENQEGHSNPQTLIKQNPPYQIKQNLKSLKGIQRHKRNPSYVTNVEKQAINHFNVK